MGLAKSQAQKRLTAKAREKLLDTYLPPVRQIADRVHRRLARHRIELVSLTQSGVVGLLEAAQRYDEGRCIACQDYAQYRISGEIMEYLRSPDWASRSVRSWGRKVSSAKVNPAARLGRDADPQEMASELGVSLKEYYQVDQSVNEATLLNLEDLALASNEGIAKPTQGQSMLSLFQDPQTIFENKDLIEKVAAATENLPDQERLVITRSYYEGLTLREIGESWRLTEGRSFDFKGKHFSVPNAYSEPKPLQSPYPLIISTGLSPAGRRFAGEHADFNFVIVSSLEAARASIAEIKDLARQEYGREIRAFGMGYVVCSDTEQEARAYERYYAHEKGDLTGVRNPLNTFIPNSGSMPPEESRTLATNTIASYGALPLVGTPQ